MDKVETVDPGSAPYEVETITTISGQSQRTSPTFMKECLNKLDSSFNYLGPIFYL